MTRSRAQVLALVVTVVSLTLTACGTRLERDQILQGQGVPGSSGGQLSGEALRTFSDAEGAPEVPGDPGLIEPGDRAAGPSDSTAGVPGAPMQGKSGSGSASGQGGDGTDAASGGDDAPGGNGMEASGQGDIVIGSVGTYSGPVGSILRQGPLALQAWAAAVNADGGINGRRVRVIVYDDGGDAARARSQVQDLVETRKVVALVAAMGLTQTVASWTPYVEKNRVPVVGGSCTQQTFNSSPVLLNQCTDVDNGLYGTVLLGAQKGKGKRFGGLFCTESSACSIAEDAWFNKGFAKQAGLEPVYSAKISLTQPDFTSECIQARNARVDLLTVAGDDNTVKRVAASCRRQNFSPQFLLSGPVASADMPGAPGLQDVITAQSTFPFDGVSTPQTEEFKAAFKKYARETPGPAAAQGWAAAKIFEQAVRRANGPGRPELLQALYSFKNQTFGGLTVPLSYGPGGTAKVKCVFLMQANGGKWTAPNGAEPTCF